MTKFRSLQGRRISKHYEIQVESWEGSEFTLIKDAIQFLKKQFGTSLMAWSIDKLTTVGIICDVFAKGGLQAQFARRIAHQK